MKTCGYCGHENADEATACGGCGTSFVVNEEPRLSGFWGEWGNQPISSCLKWMLWFAAWCAVILAMKPANIWAAPYFPLGLLALFPRGLQTEIALGPSPLPGAIGWTFYMYLSALIGRAKKRGAFLLIYVVFCILLALNVVGCQKTIQAVQGLN